MVGGGFDQVQGGRRAGETGCCEIVPSDSEAILNGRAHLRSSPVRRVS